MTFILLKAIAILCLLHAITGTVEFTNLKCISWDPEFLNFEYCHLKAFNRSFKYLALKANLYKIPVKDAMVNVVLLKRFGGFNTYLYNHTIDGCKLLRDKKSNPIITYLYSIYKVYSNLNHTCPYDHDIIAEKMPAKVFGSKLSELLSFAHGEYIFQSNWFSNNTKRATVNVYLSYT